MSPAVTVLSMYTISIIFNPANNNNSVNFYLCGVVVGQVDRLFCTKLGYCFELEGGGGRDVR